MSCEAVSPEKGLQGLRLKPRPLLSNQTYVLDLNVFFDVVKKRLNRDIAARIISSGLNNEIRVFVTPEFTAELKKHSNSKQPDPILEFAHQLPTLPQLSQNEIDRLTKELNAIIFSDRPITGVIGTRNYSDLVHLSYCIHHCATGFITHEKAILAANSQLQEAYLLEVLSAADLMLPGDTTIRYRSQLRANFENKKVRIGPARENQRDVVEQFLVSIGANRADLPLIWHPGNNEAQRRRIIARTDDELIAVASWDNPKTLGQHKVLHLYVNERLPQAEMVIDHFFESALRDVKPFSARLIILNTGPEQLNTQSTAVARGFLSSFSKANNSSRRPLSKFTFTGLITKDNWHSFRNAFRDLTDHRLPEKMPNFTEFINTGIVIRNQKGTPVCLLCLFEFEILVSPGIVLCPGREALIVPIKKGFAKNLFELPQTQPSLFPAPEALLHVEKAYFRNPRNALAFKRGKLVLFYLSGAGGGSKEVVGCARITFSEVLSVNDVNVSLARQGVLSPELLDTISDKKKRVHAFTFDNFNLFPKRIPFKTLKSKKMISGANLVTAEQLSAKNLAQACEMGFCFRD
jgi:predicted nucleic acid-binding protein